MNDALAVASLGLVPLGCFLYPAVFFRGASDLGYLVRVVGLYAGAYLGTALALAVR